MEDNIKELIREIVREEIHKLNLTLDQDYDTTYIELKLEQEYIDRVSVNPF